MGILRLLLALSVVVMHCDGTISGYFLVGGQFAVKLFFIISGFYMALILHGKYSGPDSTRLFYQNRLLRLLPTYYVILGLALLPAAIGMLTDESLNLGQLAVWQMHGGKIEPSFAAFLKLLHLSPLGQELVWAGTLDLDQGVVHFNSTSDGGNSIQLFYFMLLPPAWSLSVELQFYALAPYLVRRGAGLLAGGLLISVTMHWLLPLIPFGTADFWRNQTIFCGLAYFILGVLAHCVWKAIPSSSSLQAIAKRGPLLLVLTAGMLIAYPWLPTAWRSGATAVAFAGVIPFIFSATRLWTWDRQIGELSYPLYLGHWLVMSAWYGASARFGLDSGGSGAWQVLAVAVLSLALATAVHCLIERPIDRFRQRRVTST